ncbi:uncharacterized protein BDZ99DRAFT_468003 [Mytilinidion resinicola]|uniref:F-box domain-containing protein n=1 Tax=Mytilinidion resinicola TaxID=574789 RepID=A0A6A6Y5U9_9PEZI|nr:uncharacterized protein BDZ99DRAFT_468003 [Mytilinidion resinicola]KAF2803903.1 hypothetical protein BDZ99DRAFT_468003 [Mytilinidion resinicola]
MGQTRSPSRTEGKDFILQLPNELLVEIFILSILGAANYWGFFSETCYPAWQKLSGVCTRFSAIAKDLLYKNVSLYPAYDPYMIPPCRDVNLLRQRLCENPELALLCRTLEIYVIDDGDEACVPPHTDAGLLMSFKNARRAILHGTPEFSARGIDMLPETLHAFPALTELVLLGININDLLILDLPHLRTLRVPGPIRRFKRIKSGLPGASYSRGSSSITTLELPLQKDKFDSIAELARWPKALEHLDFYNRDDLQRRNMDWSQRDMDRLQTILDTQRLSLKSLRIGINKGSCVYGIQDTTGISFNLDFSKFPALEKIRFAPWSSSTPSNLSLPPLLHNSPGHSPEIAWMRTKWEKEVESREWTRP